MVKFIILGRLLRCNVFFADTKNSRIEVEIWESEKCNYKEKEGIRV